MKILIFSVFLLMSLGAAAQDKEPKPDPKSEVLVADAACGQCKLGLKGKGCQLAVKIKEVAYFVDGTDIDSHGDAHAADGFCNAVRKARVQGRVVKGRFEASYFQLVKEQ